ncbi:hypothetical protein ACFLY6_01930 [Candidatus Dependentiae bacterium]
MKKIIKIILISASIAQQLIQADPRAGLMKSAKQLTSVGLKGLRTAHNIGKESPVVSSTAVTFALAGAMYVTLKMRYKKATKNGFEGSFSDFAKELISFEQNIRENAVVYILGMVLGASALKSIDSAKEKRKSIQQEKAQEKSMKRASLDTQDREFAPRAYDHFVQTFALSLEKASEVTTPKDMLKQASKNEKNRKKKKKKKGKVAVESQPKIDFKKRAKETLAEVITNNKTSQAKLDALSSRYNAPCRPGVSKGKIIYLPETPQTPSFGAIDAGGMLGMAMDLMANLNLEGDYSNKLLGGKFKLYAAPYDETQV